MGEFIGEFVTGKKLIPLQVESGSRGGRGEVGWSLRNKVCEVILQLKSRILNKVHGVIEI